MGVGKIWKLLSFALAAAACGVPAASALEWWPTPYRLTLERTEAYTGDFYSVVPYVPDEGEQEYLLIAGRSYGQPFSRYNSHYRVCDTQFKTVEQLNLPWTVAHASGHDIDGDGVRELFISYLDDTLAGLRVYEWPSRRVLWDFYLSEHDFRWRNNQHWDVRLVPAAIVDTPSVPQRAVIVRVAEGYACMPSGILLLDAATGRQLWHRWMAASMDESLHLLDSDGDDRFELIGGTSASCNGARLDGMSDDHSYVYSINMDGNVRWLHDVPVQFSLCMPWPVVQSGNRELMVLQAVHGPSSPDILMRLDAADGSVLASVELPTGGSNRWIEPWNPGLDGRERWIMSTTEKAPIIGDANLTLEPQNGSCAGRIIPKDLDGDGVLEALCFATDGTMEVRDSNLELMARISGPLFDPVILRAPGQKWADIYVTDEKQLYCYSLSPTPYYAFNIAGRVAGGGALIFLLGFGPVWAIRARAAYVKTRQERQRMRAWAALASKLAHDVRTPVSVLRLSSENLEMELEAEYGQIPAHIREYFRTFRTETERTENVARGLLKFTRQAPPVLEQLDLGELVRQTVERHPHSPEVVVHVSIEPDLPPAFVDHQQMVSLLENLMSNSLKAMKGRGELDVSLRRVQEVRGRDTVRDLFALGVRDTGRGIPAHELPRIFEPYFSHADGGTGLGLAIVKKIVEDHHGTIQVDSTVGAGTIFTVRIPARPEAADE